MKKLKNLFNEQMIYCAFLSSLTIVPSGFLQYRVYESGFVKSYNQAVMRNVNLDNYGEFIPSEEMEFKQILIKELGELASKKKNLSEIVNWLNEK